MTNFEACGVLLNLRKRLQGELNSLKAIHEENADHTRDRSQAMAEYREQIEALNKAGAALTKRG